MSALATKCVKDTTVLRPVTSPTTCSLACLPGYDASGTAEFACGARLANGAAPTTAFTCTERTCAAVTWSAAGVKGGASDACVKDSTLLTPKSARTCSLAWLPGANALRRRSLPSAPACLDLLPLWASLDRAFASLRQPR